MLTFLQEEKRLIFQLFYNTIEKPNNQIIFSLALKQFQVI